MSLFVFTPNPTVDLLDPANWWPHYSAEADLRAIPAATAIVLGLGEINGACWTSSDPNEFQALMAVDYAEGPGKHVVFHVDDEEMVPGDPDSAVYIAQATFSRLLPKIPAALLETFDVLWAHHKAGRISRSAFDSRAADLRGFRDHVTKMMEIRKHG